MQDHGATVQLTQLVSRILAPNPGPMTLEGTNTYLVRSHPAAAAIVIDPGPKLPEHLDRICAAGQVGMILVTHEHSDHTESIATLHERTGAPVRGVSREWCIAADPLADGEVIAVDGVSVVVHHTPGHTADSACFEVLHDATLETAEVRVSSVCTGDTLLGSGSTIVPHPGGSLAQYLTSLERIRLFGSVPMLPGHGPAHEDVGQYATAMLAHRVRRLQQVRDLVQQLGSVANPDDEDLVERITRELYAKISAAALLAARSTVRAQLAYLHEQSA